MTRKDYILLAEALRNAQPPNTPRPGEMFGTEYVAWFACVCSIAHKLGVDNSRFDTARFLSACSPNTTLPERFTRVAL